MNIYDVSKQSGVSIATVSRVLNGNPNVSQRTRDKVLKVIEEVGYKPNVFARGLGLGTIQTIGIMCSDSTDPYLAHAIYYLDQGLRSNGYDSVLCCTGNSHETNHQYFNLLRSKKVDAIILLGSEFIQGKLNDNSYITDAAKEMPIMLVNHFMEGDNIYCTVCDDRTATRQAAGLLISSGCRKIVYLFHGYSYSDSNKIEGYRDALISHGLSTGEESIHYCENDVLAARDLLLRLHRDGLQFDGVLASDDTLAVGAVKYAHLAGLHIPDDLSIVGYNNSSYAVCTEPELTSIDSKVETMCTTTINTLMDIFQGVSVPSRTTITSELIKRATTKF